MILTPPLQHQVDALEYLKVHDPCALFLRYGTGKSLVALAYADHIKAPLVLITSDKTNATDTWVEQIETHTDFVPVVRPRDPNMYDICGYDEGTVVCVLINYDLLPSVSEIYAKLPFDLWIGDESSDFKDTRTDRFYHLNKVVRNIPHKIILNGDPMTERPEDLFGQFKMLDGGQALGRSLTEFRRRHMQLDPLGYRWCLKRSAMTHIHEAIKDVSYWHDGTGVVMPKRKYHVVYVDKTSYQETLDSELRTWFAAEFNGNKIEVQHAAVLFIKRIQLMGGVFRPSTPGDETGELGDIFVPTNKYPMLKELLDRNLDKKIVVWHEYVPETDLISSKLKCDGYDHWVFDDSSNLAPLHQFQAAPNGVLLIRNSFCKGLNTLADGDIAVVWSNPLSYRDRSQMLGRTCRMSSKTHETHVVDIVTRGGADEIVYGMLSQKRSMALTLTQLRSMVAPQ